ncbi:hypothetical protein [Enterobacter asburiae]
MAKDLEQQSKAQQQSTGGFHQSPINLELEDYNNKHITFPTI